MKSGARANSALLPMASRSEHERQLLGLLYETVQELDLILLEIDEHPVEETEKDLRKLVREIENNPVYDEWYNCEVLGDCDCQQSGHCGRTARDRGQALHGAVPAGKTARPK